MVDRIEGRFLKSFLSSVVQLFMVTSFEYLRFNKT